MEKKNILIFSILGVAITIVIILLFIVNPFSADPPATKQNNVTEQDPSNNSESAEPIEQEKETTTSADASTNKSKSNSLEISDDVHVVSEGETLKSIARDVLGDEKMWFNLFLANESTIDWYDTIYVGQKLKLPKVK